MDLLFFTTTLCFRNVHQGPGLRRTNAKNKISHEGERGDITLPVLLSLLIGTTLLMGYFWLNRAYEIKTKEHLNDFQDRWHNLEKRYQN